MDHQLTAEFAKNADLSINPFTRHKQVKDMLSDASIIGQSVHVETGRMVVIDERPEGWGAEIPIYQSTERSFLLGGFLGRKALKNVANIIDWVDHSIYETVGGTCT